MKPKFSSTKIEGVYIVLFTPFNSLLQGLFPWLRTVARTPCFIVTALRAQGPGADRSVADPELCGDLAQAVALRLQFQNLFLAHSTLRAAQRLAIRLRIPNSGSYPFPYSML
jgi:hypothetical protein